jgi:hypothetical protein
MVETALILVRRGGRYADRFRRYRIYVNGALVGRIWPKSVLEIDVPIGAITIEARIDWCAAEPLVLFLGAGDKAVIEVSNTFGMVGAAAMLELALPETYLTITKVT